MDKPMSFDDILKCFTDLMYKMRSLFNLYNSSLVVAEGERDNVSTYYEQLVDCKDSLQMITTDLSILKKSERVEAFSRYKAKIARIDKEVDDAHKNFNASRKNYDNALQQCGSYKTEYKHEFTELKEAFKSIHNANPQDTPRDAIKGYNNHVKLIRSIFDGIERLISDYNVKKNRMREDSDSFNTMYDSVSMMLERIQSIA